MKNDLSIKSVIAQIQISEQTFSIGSVTELRDRFLKAPDNLNNKFDLALALIAEEKNVEAIETLLQIITADSDWNDGQAKTQIIELLDALGPNNEDGRAGRRKLSSLIFS